MSSDTRSARILVARRLREELAREGRLTGAVIRQAARGLGVSTRTVRRDVFGRGLPTWKRPRYTATSDDITAFFENHGHYRRAYAQRLREGASLPSLRTFERAIKHAQRPGDRAFAKEGEVGRRRHQVYPCWEPQTRNEVWEVDHKVLDVWVLPDHRSKEPVRPGVILFIDGATRGVTGYSLSLKHTTDDVLAALRHAVSPDPEIGPFQGVPQVVRFDNGLEFLSHGFTDALRTLGAQPWAAPPYRPEAKGKVERLNRTISEEFCAGLPHASATPRTANPKRFYGPEVNPLDMKRLDEEFRKFVAHYNAGRAHSALGGKTPQQKWESDATPLQICTEAELRFLSTRRATRHIGKDGIHFKSVIFLAAELNGLAGEPVEVAYDATDLREIGVYRDGEFLCRARARHMLTAEERLAFLSAIRQDRKRSGETMRKASRRKGLRYVESGLTTLVAPGGKRDVYGKPRPQRKLTAPSKRKVSKLLGLDKYREDGKSNDA